MAKPIAKLLTRRFTSFVGALRALSYSDAAAIPCNYYVQHISYRLYVIREVPANWKRCNERYQLQQYAAELTAQFPVDPFSHPNVIEH